MTDATPDQIAAHNRYRDAWLKVDVIDQRRLQAFETHACSGIPSRSPNGASDRERAGTPSRRALPTWIGDINALDMAFMGVVAMALGVAIVA